jgi:hypothetical protein
MTRQTQFRKPVPILITWDMDAMPWISLEKRQWALNAAMDLCHQQGVHATFFFTAQPAHEYPAEFEQMRMQGHEIGCHGLTHGNEEDYNRMSEETQRAYITEATEKLQALTGIPIRAFRSPRVKTSAHTLALLAEHGYLVDSSVCSQRIDLISSNLLNIGWIYAPRRPYHPHHNSAFRSGNIPIWEVPVSAVVVPFIEASLRVFGLSAMKMFFSLLYAESCRTGKPIVYLAHPDEFLAKRTWSRADLQRKYFTISYIRTHGLRLRQRLYRMNGQMLLDSTKKLLCYMASFPDVVFLTASEYVQACLEK